VFWFYFLRQVFIFYFIFKLVCINNLRGFHLQHAFSVLWTSSCPSCISFLPFLLPPFTNSVWWVLLCCLHLYMWDVLRSSSFFSVLSFPLAPLSPLPNSPLFTFMSYVLSSPSFKVLVPHMIPDLLSLVYLAFFMMISWSIHYEMT
jgi:hypothetical protein